MPLAYALVAMVAFILLITWATLQAQIALAGFLNGESLWSKSQKQAVIDMLNYSATGSAKDFEDFQRSFHMVEVDRVARDKVISGRFNYDQVLRELSSGSAVPAAIPGIIFLLQHFPNAPYVGHALALWRSTDGPMAKLGVIANKLHSSYLAGAVSQNEIVRQRGRINAINDLVEPRANKFSMTIANGAVSIGKMLYGGVLLSAAVALLLWLWMARRVLAGIRG
ncbi:MAG: diguanylate cyclase, partial [Rhodanobacteraceae bacterium]